MANARRAGSLPDVRKEPPLSTQHEPFDHHADVPSNNITASAAVRSSRLVQGGLTTIQAIHAGLWLGFLDEAALDAATEAFYSDRAKNTDESYTTSGLFPWERLAIESHMDGVSSILVPAAGTGREVIALANLGYTVVGYDPSSEMVARGRDLMAEYPTAHLVHAPAESLPTIGLEPFDAVVFGWGGISHIQRQTQRITTLTALANQLTDEGLLLVSFLSRPATARPFRVAASIANKIRQLLKRPSVELGDWMSGSFDHFFTMDEMETELRRSGFEVVESNPRPYANIVARKR